MKIVAVIAQKGGVGKTTTAIELAVADHLAGLAVGIIDLDPQATAAKWGDRRSQRKEDDGLSVIGGQASRLAVLLDTARTNGSGGSLSPRRPSCEAMEITERRSEIADICRRFGVSRLAVFGSAARGNDFDPARRTSTFWPMNRRRTPSSATISRCATSWRRPWAKPSTSSSRGACAIRSFAPASSGRRRRSMDHDPRALSLGREGPGLSSEAKCNTPADLISARLVKTLRSVAMRSYSHLSEDERDQIGILRAAGQSMGAIARVLCRAKTTISRELQRERTPHRQDLPLHAAEPINCAGGVKRSSNERPIYVFSCVIGWPRDGRPSRSPRSAKLLKASTSGRGSRPLLIRERYRPKRALPFFEMNWARNSRNHQTMVVCSPRCLQ